MSVQGKRKNEWVAVTCCDFGTPGRVDDLRYHFSVEAAKQAFRGLARIYAGPGRRIWTVMRSTGEVIRIGEALPLDAIHKQAVKEGWDLFTVQRNGKTLLEIERDDDAARFPTDVAAVEHVTRQAASGSLLHAAALRLDGYVLPKRKGG